MLVRMRRKFNFIDNIWKNYKKLLKYANKMNFFKIYLFIFNLNFFSFSKIDSECNQEFLNIKLKHWNKLKFYYLKIKNLIFFLNLNWPFLIIFQEIL